LHIDTLRFLHWIVAWTAIALLAPMFVVLALRGVRLAAQFTLLVAATLMINAFVCSTLSEPVDRYQSRVLWPAVLAAAAGAANLAERYRAKRPVSGHSASGFPEGS